MTSRSWSIPAHPTISLCFCEPCPLILKQEDKDCLGYRSVQERHSWPFLDIITSLAGLESSLLEQDICFTNHTKVTLPTLR
jgi:hypothetical protein